MKQPICVLLYTHPHLAYHLDIVRLEKFQFLEKGQNRNFGYKIIILVKHP